jgi:2'-5' RNA ligase
MPRLFVALDLPTNVKDQLLALQPRAVRGVLRTSPEQLHVTLHSIGEAWLTPVADALASVHAEPFTLDIRHVGFISGQYGPILWVGVARCPELLALHQAVADALAVTGYQPEQRPFAPHITLARCESRVPQRIIEDFLTRNAGFMAEAVPVDAVTLFSSQMLPTGVKYHRERIYPLGQASIQTTGEGDSP